MQEIITLVGKISSIFIVCWQSRSTFIHCKLVLVSMGRDITLDSHLIVTFHFQVTKYRVEPQLSFLYCSLKNYYH